MPFNTATRRKLIQLDTLTRPAAGGMTSLQLPKTGLLARLHLVISATVAGTIAGSNQMGASSIVKRVRLQANNGTDIINVSGPGYAYGMRHFLDSGYLTQLNQGTTVVSATTFNLSMVLPIMINSRDPVGLIMLQNEETQLTLTVEWEATTTVDSGATGITATCIPFMEFYTVPSDPRDWPQLNLIHQWLEESTAIAAAGTYDYDVPRGNTYLRLIHGYGWGVSGTGADDWSSADLFVNQSDFLEHRIPAVNDVLWYFLHGTARPLGTIAYDFLGTSGLGSFGISRDLFNSALVTSFKSRIVASAADTRYTLRNQLVALS